MNLRINRGYYHCHLFSSWTDFLSRSRTSFRLLITLCLVFNTRVVKCESREAEVPNNDLNESGSSEKGFQESPPQENLSWQQSENQAPLQNDFINPENSYQNFRPIPPVELKTTTAHYAFSPVHLTNLAHIEESIYSMLTTYEQKLIERLNIVQRYRNDYASSVLESLKDYKGNQQDSWSKASYLMFSPFLNHRMIKRFSTDIRQLYDNLFPLNTESDIINNLELLRGDYLWPSENDVQESSHMLLRLRDAYDTDILDFVTGKVTTNHHQTTDLGLRAIDTIQLADQALNRNDKLTASELLKAAKVQVEEWGDPTTTVDNIHRFWEWIHGYPMTAKRPWNIDDLQAADELDLSRKERKAHYEDNKFALSFENRRENYKAVCRGEQIPRQKPLQSLQCVNRLVFPSFTFERVEFLSADPKVLIIHNLFGDETTREITSGMGSYVMSAMHRDTEKTDRFPENTTTGYIWVTQLSPSFVKALSRVMTLLQLQYGQAQGPTYQLDEPILLSVIGVGGFSEPFYDPDPNPVYAIPLDRGERIASAHFILEEPDAGGEFAFTQLGLRVKASRGSVLVLYNSAENGQLDERLLRGTCPVILGNKWVASSFFHENSNVPKLKCLMNKT